jgi:cytochrome c oxidase subunit 2
MPPLSARAFCLLLIAAVALVPGGRVPTAAQADAPRVIEVIAKRFAFEPSQIDVTVGERVLLSVRSADGVHGMEIKKLKVKKEIPRGGEAVVIEFTAADAGRFPIVCSEYCGEGHEDMKGMLVVQAREDHPSADAPRED